MEPILNNLYRLSGGFFSEKALERNDGVFKYVGEDGMCYVFEGVKSMEHQYVQFDRKESVHPLPVKAKRRKRKKGKGRHSPSVNKARILFCSGESYTVKDFVSVIATAESVVFIMEDNYKGTVNCRQATTVPNDDVAEIKVRGVNHQFVLDMSLTNLGVVVFQASGVEMFVSNLDIVV